jgi:hypothetical protein
MFVPCCLNQTNTWCWSHQQLFCPSTNLPIAWEAVPWMPKDFTVESMKQVSLMHVPVPSPITSSASSKFLSDPKDHFFQHLRVSVSWWRVPSNSRVILTQDSAIDKVFALICVSCYRLEIYSERYRQEQCQTQHPNWSKAWQNVGPLESSSSANCRYF